MGFANGSNCGERAISIDKHHGGRRKFAEAIDNWMNDDVMGQLDDSLCELVDAIEFWLPTTLTDQIDVQISESESALCCTLGAAKSQSATKPEVAKTGNSADDRWRTLSECGSCISHNKGTLSGAVSNGDLKSNGKSKRDLRVDVVDLVRFLLDRNTRPGHVDATNNLSGSWRQPNQFSQPNVAPFVAKKKFCRLGFGDCQPKAAFFSCASFRDSEKSS